MQTNTNELPLEAPAARAPYVSVVIPVYNEEAGLAALYERLFPVLDGLNRSYEVIFTNDGSRDRTSEVLFELYKQRPRHIRIIEFNRNYGQHMAIMAGFERARGEVIINMDADLQNPPEEIPRLLALFEQGHDVVGSYRMKRKDVAWRRWVSKLSNWVRAKSTGVTIRDQGCMLRAYSRDVVRQITASEETSTFIPVLAQLYAANPAEIGIRHDERKLGQSNYNLYKLIRYNFDLMTGFSIAPLQVFTMFGMLVSFSSLCLVGVIAFRRIFYGPEAEGLFTLFGILFFLMGVIITGLGIVGEYIGRINQMVRGRPRFHVKRVIEDID